MCVMMVIMKRMSGTVSSSLRAEAFWAQTDAPDIDWVADSDFIISTLIGASAPDKILDLRGMDEDAEDAVGWAHLVDRDLDK